MVAGFGYYVRLCPAMALSATLHARWAPIVIDVLDASTVNVGYTDLRRVIPGVTQKVLTQTLHNLMRDGFVQREAEGIPLRTSYALTALGKSFADASRPTTVWANRHVAEVLEHRQAWSRR